MTGRALPARIVLMLTDACVDGCPPTSSTRSFKLAISIPNILKAGIVETNFYEPIVQRTYSAYAAHYGFANGCLAFSSLLCWYMRESTCLKKVLKST